MVSILNTIKGGNITENLASGLTMTDANNRVSNIIAVDLQVSNNVIHVIDKVVLPPIISIFFLNII